MPFAPHAIPVLKDETGDYCEYTAHLPLPSLQAAHTYYLRCGALLCVCYMLGSKDMHCENIIAHGEYPLLADMETLLNGNVRSFLEPMDKAVSPVYPEKENCLLHTSLLPHITFLDEESLDVGGFSGHVEADTAKWLNIPFLENGTHFWAQDHIPQIIEGFQTAYQWLLNHREDILQHSPYAQFAHCTIRILLRPTQVYTRLLHRLQQPDMQASAERYQRQLEKLSLAFTRYAHPTMLDRVIPIYHAEAAAIRRGDIPRFHLQADDTALYDDNDQPLCPDYLTVSPFRRSNDILMHMDQADCALQTDMIRAAFCAAYPEKDDHPPLTSPSSLSLEHTALSIGQMLLEKAFPLEDHSPGWFVSCPAAEGMGGVTVCDDSLYSGRAGIALFLAALWKTQGTSWAREAALQITHAIIRQTEKAFKQKTYLRMSLGWGNGLGGLLAALWDISRYLADETLFPDHWLEYVQADWLEKDNLYDVLGGAAGLIIAMKHCSIRNTALITRLAEHILNGLQPWQGLPLLFRPWQETQPLTGYGHGAAGIAVALMWANEITRNSAYEKAAHTMLQYEHTCYNPAHNNWPDYRKNDAASPVFMHGWCAGAPGIGLSRRLLGKDCFEAETWAENHLLLPYDHLCCGNAGLIDFLLIMGQQNAARKRVNALACRHPHYRLVAYNGPNVINAGLFSGIAGIGYACLRVCYPDTVHSILY